MTNKLEHCVPESGRALRTLHMERRKTQKNEMKNVLALNPDLPQIVIRDLNGQAFPVVAEAVTLGMTYGLAFGTASIIFRMRISKMQNAMDQYRLVWQSDLSVKAKTEKMNALVRNLSLIHI